MGPKSLDLHHQTRSLATSLALVALIGAISRSCLVTFVFPSGDVTLAKLVWLTLGMGLAGVQLQNVVHQWRTISRHQLFLVDECSRRRTSVVVTQQQRLDVETPQFQGQLAIATTGRNVGVQLQGRFTRHVPTRSQLLLALELPVEAKELGIAATVVTAVINKLLRRGAVHTSCGQNCTTDDEDVEVPHAAVPLQLCEHPLHFGASLDTFEARVKTRDENYVVGKIYTFQATVEDWRWRWAVKVMLAVVSWLPLTWMKSHPVHFVAYLVTPLTSKCAKMPLEDSRHTTSRKRYIFCFSVHCQEKAIGVDPQKLRILLPHDLHVSEVEVGSPISLWNGRNQRGGGVPWAHAEACRRIAEDARALGRLAFSLDVWVEFVDRADGRRKVGYLLEVVDMVQQRKRTVLRSAITIKNALLLLRLEHQLDRKETRNERGVLEDEDPEEQDNESVDFQNLVVESREYRYEQIEHETSAVAHVLDQVASKPSQGRRCWRQPQSCYQHQLEKSTLFRCLAAPSHLPSVQNCQAIGVQISDTQHEAMNIVYEAGIYRLHGSGNGMTPLLRQEWFVVTVGELQFFRSYSVAPALSVPITNVLNVCSINRVRLLNGNEPADAHHEEKAVPRWYCVEIHLVLEIITLFVETSTLRDQLVASLQPLTNDDCDLHVLSSAVGKAGSEAVAASPLFSPMILNSQTQPVCLNQRTSRFVGNYLKAGASETLKLVQESLEAGLEVFALGEVASRGRISRAAVLRFLDKIEQLNGLDLDAVATLTSYEQRFALALNMYHTLFIHAVLVYGYPQSHEQWKLMQTVPCYLVCVSGGESVRFTLADIQRAMLRCPVPVTLEASGLKRNLSQNALMDLAIGGGDAINGLCRTVLGVSWTPTFPTSSSYGTVNNTPLPIPASLAVDRTDVRTSMVLQINNSPPRANTMGIMCVYDGRKLDEQLNASCTAFLSREVHLDEVNRVIYLPRICEWYQISYHDDDLDAHDDAVSRRMGPLTQRRRRSSSGSVNGVAALSTSRSFFCLQRLLGFMEVEQHHRVMHLLLGAGDECRFVFDEFWTRPSRSVAVSLLSSAGAAALSVFTGSAPSNSNAIDESDTRSSKSTEEGSDSMQVDQERLRSYF